MQVSILKDNKWRCSLSFLLPFSLPLPLSLFTFFLLTFSPSLSSFSLCNYHFSAECICLQFYNDSLHKWCFLLSSKHNISYMPLNNEYWIFIKLQNIFYFKLSCICSKCFIISTENYRYSPLKLSEKTFSDVSIWWKPTPLFSTLLWFLLCVLPDLRVNRFANGWQVLGLVCAVHFWSQAEGYLSQRKADGTERESIFGLA